MYLVLSQWAPADEAINAEAARRTAAVMAWMAVWWLSSAIPLPATSLIPFSLFPLLGVLSPNDAAAPYANRVIFLYMGGFMIAKAMERWELHKRIALYTVLILGGKPSMMIAGFMLATAGLSMWLSNTATTVMMLPIVVSVVGLVEARLARDDHTQAAHVRNFATCTLLGIAYAASIGGIATPIGTPPNATLLGFLEVTYGMKVSFFRWMLVGTPLVIVFLPIIWLLLTRVICPVRLPDIPGGRALIKGELRALGPMTRGEWTVLSVFLVTVALWMFRGFAVQALTAEDGSRSPALQLLAGIDDAGVAILAAVALFALPVNIKTRTFALNWDTAKSIPWGILLLFGGGLSLAAAVKASGLDRAIGLSVEQLGGLPGPLIVLAVAAIVIFLTELTSNTATAAIFVAILAGVAIGIEMDPLLLAVPAAVAASCAFMMPVATPPNAIVYSTGRITIGQMAKAGFALNLIGILLVTALTYTAVIWVLGATTTGLPEWAVPAN